MGVNGVNNAPVTWSSQNTERRGITVDASTFTKPANMDKLVLVLPVSETTATRKEFVTNERTAEGSAFCYTYMERTLTFADGSTFTSTSRDSTIAINLDKHKQTFGKSGADMNDMSHAVEETLEYRERSLSQTSISGGISGSGSGNGGEVGGSLGFAAQSSVYKYSSVSKTKGAILFKNGAIGNYRENAFSVREIYNKCAVFLAEAFGDKDSAPVLSDLVFNALFGKSDDESSAQKSGEAGKQLDSLRAFMEEKLAAVRESDPENAGLKVFEDTYQKLGAYKYSEIAALVEKMFTDER